MSSSENQRPESIDDQLAACRAVAEESGYEVVPDCVATTGIQPFHRLVHDVMTQPPYCEARRVFWILDNGSSHRGLASVQRLQAAFPTIVPVHGPVHASWLNQIEIYFSIVQGKALTPNDFASLADVEDRVLAFQRYYESIATPFDWRFTREDLHTLLVKVQPATAALRPAASQNTLPDL